MSTNILKEVLTNAGIRQKELARSSGVSTTTIYRVCKGIDPAPTTMQKIVRGLNSLIRPGYTYALEDVFPSVRESAPEALLDVRERGGKSTIVTPEPEATEGEVELSSHSISVDLDFTVWVDPGRADLHDITALFRAMSDLHRAAGGTGLVFHDSQEKTLVVEKVYA